MNFTKLASRLFGRFANTRFPRPIQRYLNKTYVSLFKINLSEFAPLESYPTLNALFTRALKVPRRIDTHALSLISPTDSLITEAGEIDGDCALQIKGMSYKASELVGENLSENLSFINFYLSPRDYHRYHAPCNLQILELRHFGGVLLPVNQQSLKKNQNLFIQNERVVLKALDPNGKILYFIAVGALNVGTMRFNFEDRLEQNAQTKAHFKYTNPIEVKKGDELGRFEMGSTVVIFAENVTLNSSLIGQKVRFGERVASFMLDSKK